MNEHLGVGHFKTNSLEKRIAQLPFGIYQGWITVATIANITAWLVASGWRGGGISEAIWAVGLIIIGAIIAVFILFRQNNMGHGFAVAWAFLGIYLKRNGAVEMGSELVAYTAIGAMGLVLVVLLSRWRAWAAY